MRATAVWFALLAHIKIANPFFANFALMAASLAPVPSSASSARKIMFCTVVVAYNGLVLPNYTIYFLIISVSTSKYAKTNTSYPIIQ